MATTSEYVIPGVAVVISALAFVRGWFIDGKTDAKGEGDLVRRISDLEADMIKAKADAQQTVLALAQIPVLSGKLDGLDRLVTYRLDDIARQLHAIANTTGAPITRNRGGREDPN
jgi:hypothetical protein